MLNRLCEPILGRSCGIWDKAQQDYAHQAAVEDKAFAEGDDGLGGGSCFHIFGSMAFLFAILMRAKPKPCSVVILAFS